MTGTSVTLGLLFGEYEHGTFFFPFCVLTFQQVETSLIKCSPLLSFQKQMKRRAPIHSGTVHCGNYVFLSRYGIFSEHDCNVMTHLFLCRTEEFRQPDFSHEVSTFVKVLNPCPNVTETSLTEVKFVIYYM